MAHKKGGGPKPPPATQPAQAESGGDDLAVKAFVALMGICAATLLAKLAG